jgi:hypothetical protein
MPADVERLDQRAHRLAAHRPGRWLEVRISMTLSTLHTSQGELFAFIPDLNSVASVGLPDPWPADVARPDRWDSDGPVGAVHPCQQEN